MWQLSLVDWCSERLKVPHSLSVLTVVLFMVVAFGLCFVLVAASVEEFVRGAQIYKQRILDFTEEFTTLANTLGFDFRIQNLRDELKNLPVLSWFGE